MQENPRQSLYVIKLPWLVFIRCSDGLADHDVSQLGELQLLMKVLKRLNEKYDSSLWLALLTESN